MQRLRSIEHIADEEGVSTLYLVCASPQWDHYEKETCPKPILDWLKAHFPNAGVEQVRITRSYACNVEKGATPLFQTSDNLPKPIFRLRLTDEQARVFDEAWSDPVLQPADGKDDFFFITFQFLYLSGSADFDELSSSMAAGVEANEMAWQ